MTRPTLSSPPALRVPLELRRLTPLADPNAPKRGLSAYMFFANEQRDKLRAEQPNLKFGALPKLNRLLSSPRRH